MGCFCKGFTDYNNESGKHIFACAYIYPDNVKGIELTNTTIVEKELTWHCISGDTAQLWIEPPTTRKSVLFGLGN